MPLICPTCQSVFAGFAQSIHASDHLATLHGVVFDILVGSEHRVGLAAVFPDDDRRMGCRAVAREPRARLRPEASAPVRLRFRFAQATPDTLRGSPSRSSRQQRPPSPKGLRRGSLARSRAKAGGGRRTRTFEVIRRLIYSQLPLPLGTLPRSTPSQAHPPEWRQIWPWMTLKPGADGELPVGRFMGESPWQSQPTGGV